MRLLDQLASAVRSGLRVALAPAADPRLTFVNAHQKQLALLSQVAAAVSQVAESKRRMITRAADDRSRLAEMLEEARTELVVGRSEAARIVLTRRQMVVAELSTLELHLGEVEKDEANLRALERRLASQVDAFVARQQAIVARYNAAEAQVQIKEAVTGVSSEFAELSAALVAAEEKAEGMEARVSAIDRLVAEGLLEPSALESSLSGRDDSVDAQLAELKREVAGTGGA
ncbi:MAG TPA: hypothetical protein VLR46_02910 [Candidatus Dormibacteraeota bacterium]|nr:hypothetical protein [Candidatus Dormibacteraeota bacterium]